MLDAVLSPGKLSVVGQVTAPLSRCRKATGRRVSGNGVGGEALQPHRIARYLLQADAADGAHLRAEVAAQQVLAQSDALENLRTAIRADGRDAHLRHDFLQSLVNGLDIVLLSRRIFLLNLPALHQVVEHGERHVGAQCRSTVA